MNKMIHLVRGYFKKEFLLFSGIRLIRKQKPWYA